MKRSSTYLTVNFIGSIMLVILYTIHLLLWVLPQKICKLVSDYKYIFSSFTHCYSTHHSHSSFLSQVGACLCYEKHEIHVSFTAAFCFLLLLYFFTRFTLAFNRFFSRSLTPLLLKIKITAYIKIHCPAVILLAQYIKINYDSVSLLKGECMSYNTILCGWTNLNFPSTVLNSLQLTFQCKVSNAGIVIGHSTSNTILGGVQAVENRRR